RAAAFDGLVELLVHRTVAALEHRVGAGVQLERYALGLTCGDDRLHRLHRLGQWAHPVLDVRARYPNADRPADGLAGIAVTVVEVGGDRQIGGLHDALDGLEHEVARDLAVGVAVRRGDRVTSGRNGLGRRVGSDDLRGDGIPDVDHLQDLGGFV